MASALTPTSDPTRIVARVETTERKDDGSSFAAVEVQQQGASTGALDPSLLHQDKLSQSHVRKPFMELIFSGQKQIHDQAASAMHGIAHKPDEYEKYLRSLQLDLGHLEKIVQGAGFGLPTLPKLYRSEALAKDLAHYNKQELFGQRETYKHDELLGSFAAKPHLALCHLTVHIFGDLFGGQAIKHIVLSGHLYSFSPNKVGELTMSFTREMTEYLRTVNQATYEEFVAEIPRAWDFIFHLMGVDRQQPAKKS